MLSVSLTTVKDTLSINGKETEAYTIIYISSIYQNAIEIKHVQTIEDKHLNLSHDCIPLNKQLSNSRDNGIVNREIIRRLRDMKANPKLARIIRIDAIHDVLAKTKSINKLNRSAKDRNKERIFKILETKVATKLIDKYELKTNNKGGESIHITLHKD